MQTTTPFHHFRITEQQGQGTRRATAKQQCRVLPGQNRTVLQVHMKMFLNLLTVRACLPIPKYISFLMLRIWSKSKSLVLPSCVSKPPLLCICFICLLWPCYGGLGRLHAFEIAQNRDPYFTDRDVKHFKTALLRRLDQVRYYINTNTLNITVGLDFSLFVLGWRTKPKQTTGADR